MRDGGKGDKQRPRGIPMEEFDNKWDAIFNKKEEKKENPLSVDIEDDNGELKAEITLKVEF
jgi:hypothetical protein